MTGTVTVVEIDVEQTWDLRRRILRRNSPEAVVQFPQDSVAGVFHLGASAGEGGPVLAVATFLPTAGADDIWQLRGMAVHETVQRGGVGREVLEAGVARVRERGGRLLWANVRDTAAGFYERAGWTIVGGGFVTDDVEHHVGFRLL